MAFEFWLKDYKGSRDLLLPVTPREYSVDYGNEIEVIRATEVGDINIVGHKRPKAITLSSFFTVIRAPYTNSSTYRAKTPMDYVRLVQRWVDRKSIVRLIIADEDTTKINALFYIENILYSESNESNGDIDYTISLREYIKLKAVKTVITKTENSARAEVKPLKAGVVHTVQSGETLTSIARKFYGNGDLWPSIYNANKGGLGSNPNIIFAGVKLTIPNTGVTSKYVAPSKTMPIYREGR